MVRDFEKEYFTQSISLLAKQNTEMSTMKQSLFNALSNEYSSEFPNEYVKTKYNSISSLLSRETQNNIDRQITMGKKSFLIYNTDRKCASEQRTANETFDTVKASLKEMTDAIMLSVSNFKETSPDANHIVDALPQTRAREIKNGHLFISPDGEYLYFNGFKYKIYDPAEEQTEGPVFSPVYEWTIDGVKEVSSVDRDVWDGINGFFNSNGVSNLDDEASALFNAPMLLMGILEGAAESKNTTTITTTFKTNQYGERVAVVTMRDSSVQRKYDNWDYSKSSSMYDGCDNVSNYIASEYAKSAYEAITGNKASGRFATQYDVHITLDESHQYSDAPHYYITFGSGGKAYVTPNYYPGDKIEVTQFTNVISVRTNETTVWESSMSDFCKPTEFDNSELLLQCIMSD